MGWFASLFLGASLAACTGLRAFLPLLEVALISRYSLAGDFHIPLPLRWVESDAVLLAVAVLAVMEILADKVNLVARFCDLIVMLLRPLASVFTCLAVLNMPTVTGNFLAALAVGLIFSLPILRLKGGYRMMRGDQASTFKDPGVSLAEDILAGGATVLAFFNPVLVFLVLLAVAFWLVTRVRMEAFRRAQSPKPERPVNEALPQTGYGPPQPGLRRTR